MPSLRPAHTHSSLSRTYTPSQRAAGSSATSARSTRQRCRSASRRPAAATRRSVELDTTALICPELRRPWPGKYVGVRAQRGYRRPEGALLDRTALIAAVSQLGRPGGPRGLLFRATLIDRQGVHGHAAHARDVTVHLALHRSVGRRVRLEMIRSDRGEPEMSARARQSPTHPNRRPPLGPS